MILGDCEVVTLRIDSGAVFKLALFESKFDVI